MRKKTVRPFGIWLWIFIATILASIWLGFYFFQFTKGTWASWPTCITAGIFFLVGLFGTVLNLPDPEARS
jgi:hypothetical protein